MKPKCADPNGKSSYLAHFLTPSQASHTKATLVGSSVSIPITNGRLNVGTWQSVTLCEFRAEKHTRRIVATVTP